MLPAPDLRCNEASDAISVMTSTSFRWYWPGNGGWFVRIVVPASYACSLSHARDGGKAAALAIASEYPAGPPHDTWEVEPLGVFPRDADARRVGDLITIGSLPGTVGITARRS
jgi:hypothetical protein